MLAVRRDGASVAFEEAGVLLLSKIDLLPYIPFDQELFPADIRQLNPRVDLIELSIMNRIGMDLWISWLKAKVAAGRSTVAMR